MFFALSFILKFNLNIFSREKRVNVFKNEYYKILLEYGTVDENNIGDSKWDINSLLPFFIALFIVIALQLL